jgi:hypothetical protein
MKPAPLSYKREGGGPFEEGDSEFFLLLLSPLERSSLSLSLILFFFNLDTWFSDYGDLGPSSLYHPFVPPTTNQCK